MMNLFFSAIVGSNFVNNNFLYVATQKKFEFKKEQIFVVYSLKKVVTSSIKKCESSHFYQQNLAIFYSIERL